MKLVGSINKIEDINYIANYIDCVMLDCNIASIENLNIIISFGITPIVKFNQMIHPFEMEEIVDNIKKLLNINCLIYITDLGLAYRLKKLNVIDRVIYDPVTMITNSLDAKEYYSYGFNAVSLSNEITIDDVNKIVSKSDIKLFYQVFGYHLMLHSRRKLVSLYCEKINKKIELNNLTIKETTRNDIYPIVENDRGTFIYRSYLINLLKYKMHG